MRTSLLGLTDKEIEHLQVDALVNPPQLVDWKNAPSLQELKADLKEALIDHNQQVQKIEGWLDNLHITGKAQVNTPKGNSRIVPKLIRKQAEWRYAALSEPFLSSESIFDVKPVTWEDVESARQNSLVLDHQFNNQINKIAFIDEFVRTVVDEGTAIIRVGWEFEEEEVTQEKPIFQFVENSDMQALHEQLTQMRESSPSQYLVEVPEELKQAHQLTLQTGIPMQAIKVGVETATEMKTVKNQPTLEVCDFRNIIIDPTCGGDISKAKFIINRFEVSLSDLRKDGRYKHLEYIDVENQHNVDFHGSASATPHFTFKDKSRKKVKVFEYWGYWDIDGTGLTKPIVASWVNDVLIRMEENPYPDKKLPFVAVQYLPVRKSVYGEPDGALLEENQKILGATLRGVIDIMGKSANGQTAIAKGALDLTNRRKFEQGKDYEFNPGYDPRASIYMHTYPEIPHSAQFMIQTQNMEAESLTGVKAFSQGISQASLGNVATSVRGALDAASKRELGILRRLAQGIIQCGKKIIAMNAVFLSDEETIRITNTEFIPIKREDLSGEFDLRLNISTAEADDNKAQELAYMLQTVGNTLDPSFSQMILSEIARLRKMPDLAKRIEEFTPQQDPMREQMTQLQLQLLQAQVMSEQAKAQELSAQAVLQQAKSSTEQAKSAQLESTARLNALNFNEQMTGVKQAREKELRQAQAQSQMELAITQQQLKNQAQDKDHLKEYLLKKMDINAKAGNPFDIDV